MSFSTLPAPSDVIGINSTLHSHRYSIDGDRRRDSNSRSPTMTKSNSPLFRSSFPAEVPPQLASIYNSPYAAAAMAAAVAGQANIGLSANNFSSYGRTNGTGGFYPGITGHDTFRRAPYIPHLDFCWPQNFRSLDAIVGPRTKAPREATSILKSWLNDHKDNPYPTKSEKMTLSIVTHMTLTQVRPLMLKLTTCYISQVFPFILNFPIWEMSNKVSTWFANARRRIKKENKMTWTPKTRCGGDRDDNSSNEDDGEKDREHHERMNYRESRDFSTEEQERNHMDIDRREQRLSDGASSSRSFSPESTYRTPGTGGHPMFSSLPHLNPQFYSAAAAAAAAASLLGGGRPTGRPRMPPFPSQWEPEQDLPPTDLSTTRTKAENNWKSEEQQKKPRSPSKLLVLEKERGKSDEEKSLCDSDSKPTSPFVQLKREARSSSNVKIEARAEPDSHTFLHNDSQGTSWPGTEDPDRKVSTGKESPVNRKQERSNDQVRLENPARSDMSKDCSSSGDLTGGDADRRHFESPRENFPSQSESEEMSPRPSMPPYHPAFFLPMAGQLTPPLAKHDPLTTWIREFQQLVASGQELKAKHALATALAVAAKAGASSSGGHFPLSSPEFRADNLFASPHNRPSSSGSSVESTPRHHRISPESATNCKSAFPFPPNQTSPYLQPPRVDEKFEPTMPFARQDHHSSSEGSPSYSKNDILQSNNTPMNLTKSSTKKSWRRGDEHTTIEV